MDWGGAQSERQPAGAHGQEDGIVWLHARAELQSPPPSCSLRYDSHSPVYFDLHLIVPSVNQIRTWVLSSNNMDATHNHD